MFGFFKYNKYSGREWNVKYNSCFGFYSLIKMCILDHYNEEHNDYVKQLEIIETTYKKYPEFAPILEF